MKNSRLLPKFNWLQNSELQKGDWLPLLLLLFFGVYLPLQAFIVLALKIWQLEGGFAWEVPLLMTIHDTTTPTLDRLALIFTQFGSVKTIGPIACLIAGGLFFQKRWRSLVYLAMTLLGCGAINLAAKAHWHRLRPHLWEGHILPTDFSFPSGHAMTSMAFAIVLMVLAWRSRWRSAVVALAIGYVVTIGWTRLYLGVHYPSDILAGWMLAIAWAIGISLFVKPVAAVVSETVAEIAPKQSNSQGNSSEN
ncbi:phosphatase PAP2 family protein [Leptolyngbya ohadii]|uniref:phosphatase PAP2 family protein n=1 Tax=Leptolyngbya ohadii TaxID=1962290 RepID=UPI000B59C3E5|nr:phosphatase PAP2 family protein [Leptolyngbya ohadii]